MIEITEHKFEKIADYTEKMLKYGGKLMSCISEIGDAYGMSFREYEEYPKHMMGGHDSYGRYGRVHEGGRINYRDEEWDDDDDDMMNERRSRRRRDSRGRYM